MSKTRCLIHIVFATKHREMTITETYKKELYNYIFGILNNKNCFTHRINGMPNHIHLLIDLNPTVALADVVKDIKQFSNKWIKDNPEKFPMFDSWGKGYYAVSIGVPDLDRCKAYIIGQESHHSDSDLLSEMEHMAKTNVMVWYEDDWA